MTGFPWANLSLQTNGCIVWGWKTLSQLPTHVSAPSISGLIAFGTTMASNFWEKTPCPLYLQLGMNRQRCAFTNGSLMNWILFVRAAAWPVTPVVLTWYISVKSLQIELRKRGVVTKDTTRMVTQSDRDKAREAATQRKEKRGGLRVTLCCIAACDVKGDIHL